MFFPYAKGMDIRLRISMNGESFNGRFRDECLNEHRFLDLTDAKTIILPEPHLP